MEVYINIIILAAVNGLGDKQKGQIWRKMVTPIDIYDAHIFHRYTCYQLGVKEIF